MSVRLFASFIVMGFMLSTTACGKVSGTIGGKKKKEIISILGKGSGSEIVSSSQQSTLTTGGYRVQSSAGNTLDRLEASTAGGYKVQMTIQGVMLE